MKLVDKFDIAGTEQNRTFISPSTKCTTSVLTFRDVLKSTLSVLGPLRCFGAWLASGIGESLRPVRVFLSPPPLAQVKKIRTHRRKKRKRIAKIKLVKSYCAKQKKKKGKEEEEPKGEESEQKYVCLLH